MEVIVKKSSKELGEAAAQKAAFYIKNALQQKGQANIILATGTSQFETLRHLILQTDIDWTKVVMFHLDEYIDLPDSAPASFRKYLKERFLDKVPPLKGYYLINGENDATEECHRLNDIIAQYPIDVALVGIGENGHLAFNDPPADFDIQDPYIVVQLDEQCRMQQLGEGWFSCAEEVPVAAISMSVSQIMKSEHIICSVPDSRKAQAVKNSLEGQISNLFPASILQKHPGCSFFLDTESASLLSQ